MWPKASSVPGGGQGGRRLRGRRIVGVLLGESLLTGWFRSYSLVVLAALEGPDEL
jgi:hypothetical protein